MENTWVAGEGNYEYQLQSHTRPVEEMRIIDLSVSSLFCMKMFGYMLINFFSPSLIGLPSNIRFVNSS